MRRVCQKSKKKTSLGTWTQSESCTRLTRLNVSTLRQATQVSKEPTRCMWWQTSTQMTNSHLPQVLLNRKTSNSVLRPLWKLIKNEDIHQSLPTGLEEASKLQIWHHSSFKCWWTTLQQFHKRKLRSWQGMASSKLMRKACPWKLGIRVLLLTIQLTAGVILWRISKGLTSL